MSETMKIIEALVKLERLSKQTRNSKLKATMTREYERLTKRLDEIKRLEDASAEARSENLRTPAH